MKKLQLLAFLMLLSTSVMIVPSAPVVDVDKIIEKVQAFITTTKADMAKLGANYDYDALINKLNDAQMKMNNLLGSLTQGVYSMKSIQQLKTDAQAQKAANTASAPK